MPSWWRDVRGAALFLSGLGLVFYEAVIREGPVRSELLILYAAMMGLEAFLRADERRRD